MRYVLKQIFSGVPRWVYRLVFFMVTFISLHLMYGDVIYRLFWNGFFATNSIYQHEVVDHTGGALRYLAQFLNQLLYYPALGALLIAAWTTGVAYLLDKCCALSQLLFPISFLPSVILLALYTGVGYDVYMRIDTSFGLSTLLGILFALTLFYLYQISERLRWGEPLMLLTTALLYPALGFYALVALLMMTLRTWYTKRYFPVAVGVTLFSLFALPFIFDVWCFNDEFNWGAVSLLLPASSMKLRVLQIISVCSLVIFANPLHKLFAKRPSYCQGILWVLLFVLMYALSYKNKIYYSELKVSRWADEEKWKEIVAECKEHKTLSRTLNAYRVIALSYEGKLANQLFKVDYPFITNESLSEEMLFEEDLFFHAGFFNSSYRVSMETWQNYGLNYRRLRNLYYCSLMNGEPELAERYLRQLRQTPVLSSLEEKPKSPKEIVSRAPQEQTLFLGGATLSRYYMCFNQLPPSCYEYRILSDLWERNLKVFTYDLPASVSAFATIPECVKEAAVIAVALHGANPLLLQLAQVDEETKNRVYSFFSELRRYPKNANERLKKQYGKTYCYYYVCGAQSDKPKQ